VFDGEHMLMADDTLPLHLSSTTLAINSNKLVIIISELFLVCFAFRETPDVMKTSLLSAFMNKVFVFTYL
jgi:hypothetical protein